MIDLHVHSTYSDGTLTPAELIELASLLGLESVALCDHNTVSGLPEFMDAAERSGVEAISGVEFSTDYRGTELHILGLFVQPQHYNRVTAMLEGMVQRKEKSNQDLILALNAAGLELNYTAIKAGTPDGQVNRAVIAAEMVRKGYCESVQDAFSRWLSPKRGYYIPPERLDVFDVIRFIKSIGCVAVLAHPFLNLKEAALREFLPQARENGLDGMEVYYPKFDEETTALAGRLAEEFGLLKSGGSDFHGENKPDIRMGTGRGNLHVSYAVLEELKSRSLPR